MPPDLPCPDCSGLGWTVEVDVGSSGEPVPYQEPCPRCQLTGKLVLVDGQERPSNWDGEEPDA